MADEVDELELELRSNIDDSDDENGENDQSDTERDNNASLIADDGRLLPPLGIGTTKNFQLIDFPNDSRKINLRSDFDQQMLQQKSISAEKRKIESDSSMTHRNSGTAINSISEGFLPFSAPTTSRDKNWKMISKTVEGEQAIATNRKILIIQKIELIKRKSGHLFQNSAMSGRNLNPECSAPKCKQMVEEYKEMVEKTSELHQLMTDELEHWVKEQREWGDEKHRLLREISKLEEECHQLKKHPRGDREDKSHSERSMKKLHESKAKIKKLSNNLDELKSEKAALLDERGKLQGEIDNRDAKIREQHAAILHLQQKLAEKNKLERARLNDPRIRPNNEIIDKLKKENTELTEQLKKQTADQNQIAAMFQGKIDVLEQENRLKDQDYGHLRESYEAMQESEGMLRAELDKEKAKHATICENQVRTIRTLSMEKENARKQHEKDQRELSNKSSQIEQLSETIRAMEQAEEEAKAEEKRAELDQMKEKYKADTRTLEELNAVIANQIDTFREEIVQKNVEMEGKKQQLDIAIAHARNNPNCKKCAQLEEAIKKRDEQIAEIREDKKQMSRTLELLYMRHNGTWSASTESTMQIGGGSVSSAGDQQHSVQGGGEQGAGRRQGRNVKQEPMDQQDRQFET